MPRSPVTQARTHEPTCIEKALPAAVWRLLPISGAKLGEPGTRHGPCAPLSTTPVGSLPESTPSGTDTCAKTTCSTPLAGTALVSVTASVVLPLPEPSNWQACPVTAAPRRLIRGNQLTSAEPPAATETSCSQARAITSPESERIVTVGSQSAAA